ncbi:MAG: S-layer homology domain-containing protein [Clostridia bacterium]|nr:S-layer homology domain-containing protein [Clostridia bacterium]
MKTGRKRIPALILALCLTIGLLPMTVLAAEPENTFDVGTAEELTAAAAVINAADSGEFVINITADIEDCTGIALKKNTTTIIGNGHTLKLKGNDCSVRAEGSAVVNLGDENDADNTLTITANPRNDTAGALYLLKGGTVNMYDGVTIRDVKSTNYLGGGATVQGGILNMYGGTITNCGITSGSVGYGGGVAVFSGGVFHMYDGEISKCFLNNTWNKSIYLSGLGGGVFVSGGGTFIMDGGRITDNFAYLGGGGIAYVTLADELSTYGYGNSKSLVVINGGEISGNESYQFGGGILASGYYSAYYSGLAARNPAVGSAAPNGFYMNGGTIKNNEAYMGGGIQLIGLKVPVELKNVNIVENKATGDEEAYGGGLCTYLYWTQATMENCQITRNYAEGPGGGIADINCQSGGAKTTVTSSVLANNTSDVGGADVYEIISGSASAPLNVTLPNAAGMNTAYTGLKPSDQTGKLIDNWYLDDADDRYADQAAANRTISTVTSLTNGVDAELFLIAAPNKVTVTFDQTYAGQPADTATIATYNTKASAMSPEPTRSGLAFTGRYTDPECTTPYDFDTLVASAITLYAGWRQQKYTLHYGDGRDHDGEWGYNYADPDEEGYYLPASPEDLPQEIRYFSESEAGSGSYSGVTQEGYYFLSWMRYAETEKENIDQAFKVFTFDGSAYTEISNWRESAETLYQFLPETKTPDTDCGDVDYYAQWVYIAIDVDVDVDVSIKISGIGENQALVVIDDSQKEALAKNVNLASDVRGNNTEIKITAYVRNANDQDELSAVNEKISTDYGNVTDRIDYDVSVEKKISVDGAEVEKLQLKVLAEPIEIIFAIPDQWQSGKVYMFRTHTAAIGAEPAVTELQDLDQDAKTFTAVSDEFSTYTMICIKKAGFDPDDPGTPMLNTKDHYSYIVGYPDGCVHPEGNLTRAEAVTIFFRLLSEEIRDQYWCTTNAYSDVHENDWFNNAISTVSNLHIIDGYPDGTFRPNASITRAEFAKIAVSFFDFVAGGYAGKFSDVNQDAWYSAYVQAAYEQKLIEGYPDGTFRPNQSITRAEACTIVNRTLSRAPHKEHLLKEDVMIMWPDNPRTAWYYEAMQEASNSHDYTWITEKNDKIEQWTEKLPQRDWAALEKAWSDANSAPFSGNVVN